MLNFHTRKMENIVSCDANNAQDPFNCINRYISNELRCSYPWSKKDSIAGYDNCFSKEHLSQFHQIANEILAGKRNYDLTRYGCMLKNCDHFAWKSNLIYEFEDPEAMGINSNIQTLLQFTFMATEMEVTKEYYLYEMSNFIADVGGFLGLLLGASIASMIEILTEAIRKFSQVLIKN